MSALINRLEGGVPQEKQQEKLLCVIGAKLRVVGACDDDEVQGAYQQHLFRRISVASWRQKFWHALGHFSNFISKSVFCFFPSCFHSRGNVQVALLLEH